MQSAGDSALLLKLILAAVLGALVGAEREFNDKAAGFRTHAIVCLGSALIMEVSRHIYSAFSTAEISDPGRLAAQVVSGIGFLGAGTIIRSGKDVRGLTTAASLWTVSGVGLAVGAGLYGAAVATTLIVLVILFAFGRITRALMSKREHGKTSD